MGLIFLLFDVASPQYVQYIFTHRSTYNTLVSPWRMYCTYCGVPFKSMKMYCTYCSVYCTYCVASSLDVPFGTPMKNVLYVLRCVLYVLHCFVPRCAFWHNAVCTIHSSWTLQWMYCMYCYVPFKFMKNVLPKGTSRDEATSNTRPLPCVPFTTKGVDFVVGTWWFQWIVRNSLIMYQCLMT